MTTFHFQTHVPSSGVIALPPLPDSFRGEDITVKVDVNPNPKRESLLDEISGAGRTNDERSAEEIIREIYESRTSGREVEQRRQEALRLALECPVATEEEIAEYNEFRRQFRCRTT